MSGAQDTQPFPTDDLSDALTEETLDGNARIQGMNTVDKTQKEGTAIYDLIFQARKARTASTIGLIINLEIQNDEKLKYYVVTRGLYYCARMLSAQKNRIFKRSEYQKIQKVYSIWICPYAKNGRNTVASYNVQEFTHFGEVDVPKEEYDKLETLVITLNEDACKSENKLIRFLSLLLSHEMPLEERMKALQDEYHIQMNDSLKEDSDKMCNYSDAILKMGLDKGRLEGRAEGGNQMLYSLVCDGYLSLKKAAEKAGMKEDEFCRNAALCGYKIPII